MSKHSSSLKLLAWAAVLLVSLTTLLQLPIGQQLGLGMAPILSALQSPGRWWQETSLWFDDSKQLQSDYLEATLQLEKQSALIQEVQSLREENRQLRALLGIQQLKGYHWSAAKVQGRSPDKMSQRLILLVEQANIDDVIVSSGGLVGLVDQAKPGTAVVRTVLDASLAVPVTIPGSSLAALVRGEGDRLTVDFIPFDRAPKPGLVLVTSGSGGIFPPGLPVARITRVTPVPGQLFAHVDAEPVAHWRRESWLAMASTATAKVP